MVAVGGWNNLTVVKHRDVGLYLDAGEYGEVLLPRREVTESMEVDSLVRVFLYADSKDRLIATREQPKAMVEQCAYLKVKDVNRVGAFLDWGLPKDLLVPFNEQDQPMQKGYSYVVYVFFDEDTNRLVASSRLRDFLPEQNSSLKPKQAVDLLVYAKTEMGFKAVIDDQYRGLIFKDEAFRPLKIGQRIQGFVKRIREDGRIDLSLQKPGQAGRKDLTSQILEALEQDGGTLTLTDKSSPEDIHARFGVSKAAYKKALGALYKQRRIELSKDTVRLA